MDGRPAPLVVLPDLNEPAAGRFEGGSVDTYDDWFIEHGLGARNPGGGESQHDALRRFIRAFRVIARCQEQVVLVVAHALPLAWLTSASVGAPSINFRDPGIDLARPYNFSLEGLAGAAAALERWLDLPTDKTDALG